MTQPDLLPTSKPLPDQIRDGHRRIACASVGSITKSRRAVQSEMTERLKVELAERGLLKLKQVMTA
jgi:hypothetical protein